MGKVQILGVGCGKCQRLYDNARAAVEQTGADCEVVKITDIVEMLSFSVVGLPALAIDGRVVSSGRVLSAEQIKSLLRDAFRVEGKSHEPHGTQALLRCDAARPAERGARWRR